MTEISKEYGTALFMVACEKNQRKEFLEALETVKAVFEENPDYMAFLSSLSVSASDKLSGIEAAFSNRIPEDVVSYLQLLCEKGRMKCFFDSAEEYKRLFDESEKVSKAKVISATELLESEKNALLKKLENMKKTSVEIEYFVDESLIGGVIVEIDGKVLDGSLKSRLRDIKEVISR